MERQIFIHIDMEKLEKVPSIELYKAIGKLSSYGMSRVSIVNIRNDSSVGECGLIANYSTSNGEYVFTMGAVYDKKSETYSYHS